MHNIVSFVANDSILHYLEPFLASFRAHMPTHSALMIPYDNNIEMSSRLAQYYNISLLPISKIDPIIVELTQKVYQRDVGHLRKMHSFALKADNVLIIDVDVVIIKDLGPLIDAFAASTADIAYGEKTESYVYSKTGLALFPKSKLFSCGIMITSPARTGLLQIRDTILANFDEFMTAKEPSVQEQPIINYYVDKAGKTALNFEDIGGNISNLNFYMNKYFKLNWENGSPVVTVADRNVGLLHYAGRKNTDGDFNFKELIEFYRLKCRNDMSA